MVLELKSICDEVEHSARYFDVVAHSRRPFRSGTAGTLMTLTLGNTYTFLGGVLCVGSDTLTVSQLGAYKHGRSKERSRWRTEGNLSQRGSRCCVMSIREIWVDKAPHGRSQIECPCERGNVGRDHGVYVLGGKRDESSLRREQYGRSVIVYDCVW